MGKSNFLLIYAILFIALTGCGQVDINDYADHQPALDPATFFAGNLTAHGVVKNRGGKVIRYFNATIVGKWENGVGVLEEVFLFNDGEQQLRTWTLTPHSDNSYTATAGDVVGEAQVNVAGNAMHLTYVLAAPYGDDTIHLKMDDWMHRVNDTTIINQTVMRKFGFKVGEVVLTIVKNPATN